MSSLSKIVLLLLASFLITGQAFAATVTSCYQQACAILTVPDQIAPNAPFDITVEGYLEGGSGWDVTSYALLENTPWQYNGSHLVSYSGSPLDSKGFNWGSSVSKSYTLQERSEPTTLTFVFGSRGWQHGYYDVAVEATIAIEQPTLSVAIDLKPGSCPNPLNLNKKGVTSAAIVGSADFDVTAIDPATVKLAGVSAIHSNIEDVTTPFPFLTGKTSEYDCLEAGPDGYPDLTVKFLSADLFPILKELSESPLADGDILTLEMTADLKEGAITNTATVIGEDVVRIILKKNQE